MKILFLTVVTSVVALFCVAETQAGGIQDDALRLQVLCLSDIHFLGKDGTKEIAPYAVRSKLRSELQRFFTQNPKADSAFVHVAEIDGGRRNSFEIVSAEKVTASSGQRFLASSSEKSFLAVRAPVKINYVVISRDCLQGLLQAKRTKNASQAAVDRESRLTDAALKDANQRLQKTEEQLKISEQRHQDAVNREKQLAAYAQGIFDQSTKIVADTTAAIDEAKKLGNILSIPPPSGPPAPPGPPPKSTDNTETGASRHH